MSLMAEILKMISTTLKDNKNRKSNQKIRFLDLVRCPKKSPKWGLNLGHEPHGWNFTGD